MEPPAITLKDMLLKHFAPAPESDQGRSLKSTSDLFAILDEHAPGKFKVEELYDVLIIGGFQDKLVGESIVWSVRPVIRS